MQINSQQTIFKMSENTVNINGKTILNTGNILSVNDITKKPTQNTTEELVDVIKVTLKDYVSNADDAQAPDHLLLIKRRNDDVATKIKEQGGVADLKIGLKLFLSGDSTQQLCEAVENAIAYLEVEYVHDVIISFKQKQGEEEKDDLDQIKKVWTALEKYVDLGNIKQIGIADIEETTFRALYDWSRIKPSIIQINLATCCVVPPTLQAFCKEKEMKLLTHSDPNDILPKPTIESIFGQPLELQWALRYLIHIKCRGVLTTKGYILSLNREAVV